MHLSSARRVFSVVHRAIRKGLIQGCHDLSEGGLAVAAAEMAIARRSWVGGRPARSPVAETDLADSTRLFAESPTRFLVEVTLEDARLEKILGQDTARIGQVLDSRDCGRWAKRSGDRREHRHVARDLAGAIGGGHQMSVVASRPRTRSARVRSHPRALVMRAPGTNCDRETVIALEWQAPKSSRCTWSVCWRRSAISMILAWSCFPAASHSATISVRVRSGHTAWRPCVMIWTGSSRAAGPCSVSATASRRCSGSGCSWRRARPERLWSLRMSLDLDAAAG